MNQPPEEIILAEPRGFCAGVDRAIEIVERALTKFGAPVYVRHEIVHNDHVVAIKFYHKRCPSSTNIYNIYSFVLSKFFKSRYNC